MAVSGAPACAHSASGEEIYIAKCSSCHDSGAGQAPRVHARADWSAREVRGRNAMVESAIKGIPATAMAAKGGYAELSDAEVALTVDYMLVRVGFRDNAAAVAVAPVAAATVPVPVAGDAGALVDDATLVNRVAETLVMGSDSDFITPSYFSEALAHAIPGARLILCKGGGHSFTVTRAEQFNRDLLAFLRGTL